MGDLNGPDDRLSSSDHSDKFSQIYMYGSENGDIISSKKRNLHQGNEVTIIYSLIYPLNNFNAKGFQVYPPPTTPPEPAPPDHLMNSRQKRDPILSTSQTSLDEITCKFHYYISIYI